MSSASTADSSPAVAEVAVSPSAISGGAVTVVVTVNLSVLAPPEGVIVGVTVFGPNPPPHATLEIPAGSISGQVSIYIPEDTPKGESKVAAWLGDTLTVPQVSTVLTVGPPAPAPAPVSVPAHPDIQLARFIVQPPQATVGMAVTLIVDLNRAATDPITVSIQSDSDTSGELERLGLEIHIAAGSISGSTLFMVSELTPSYYPLTAFYAPTLSSATAVLTVMPGSVLGT